jgi:hypothetical protein
MAAATVSPLYFNTSTGFNQQINTTSDVVELFELQLDSSTPLKLTALSSGVLLLDNAGAAYSGTISNVNVAANAAIAGTKIAPDFGSQNVATTGTLDAGGTTLDSLTVSHLATLDSLKVNNDSKLNTLTVGGQLTGNGATFDAVSVNTLQVLSLVAQPGVLHNDNLGNITTSGIVNADVDPNAAIAGTKIAPDFGSQNVATTGSYTAGAAGSGSPYVVVASDAANFYDAAGTLQASVSTNGSAQFGSSLTLNALSSGKISGMTDPTAPQDAATKAYVDAVAQGLSVKNSSVYGYSSNQSLSGIPMGAVDSDQVLLTGQTNAIENGLWLVHSGAWTRPANFANGQNAAGAFTFIEQSGAGAGYLPAATGWVCTSPESAATIGTNTLAFTQFSAAGEYTAGQGIAIDSNAISVDISSNGSASGLTFAGNQLSVNASTSRGLANDGSGLYVKLAAAGALSFSAGGAGGGASGEVKANVDGSQGVQITAGNALATKIDTAAALYFGASGSMSVRADGTHAVGIDASAGLQVKLQSNGGGASGGAGYTNLVFGASGGLDVAGVPSNFLVGGAATGNSVTAANLNTLTNGSNADALHYHDQQNLSISTGALSAGTVVVISAGAGGVSATPADRSTNGRIAGIVSGTNLVATSGLVSGLSGLTPGADYYLGASGLLVAGIPGGAGYSVFVGTAISSSSLLLASVPPGTYLN